MTRSLGRTLCSCVALMVLSGCSTGEDPAPGPVTDPSTVEPSETSPEPSESVSEPTSEPAGPVLASMSATLTVPDEWKLDRSNSEINLVALAPGSTTSSIGLYDYGPVPGLTLRELTKVALRNFSQGGDPEPAPAELGGAKAYQLVSEGGGRRYVELGAIRGGMAVDLSFDFADRDFSPAEQQEIIDAVLASFEWS